MSASADFKSAYPKARITTGGRASVVALAVVALMASSPQAFALKIPIAACLSGGGEVPSNNSPARGLMQGTFDTDTNTLEWTVTYSGLTTEPIGAHFHGPVSYLGLTAEENAPIQVATPGSLASPFHGVAKIRRHPGQGPERRPMVFQPALKIVSGRRNSRTCRAQMRLALHRNRIKR